MNLVSQENVDDIFPHLQETFLKDYITAGVVWDDFGDIADRCFYEMAMSIREECPVTLPVDIFLLRGDYLNLKSALMGESSFSFPPGIISLESLQDIAWGELSGVPWAVSEGEGHIGDTNDIDPGTLDILLDGAYLRHMLSIADELGSPMINAYVNDRVLASLVTILWRASKQNLGMKKYLQHLLPVGDFDTRIIEIANLASPELWPAVIGGAVGDFMLETLNMEDDEQIATFEMKVANHLTSLIHNGKLQTAGPEKVFSFVGGLYVEMQNMKLAVAGRLNRIDRALLKLRLKDCYA